MLAAAGDMRANAEFRTGDQWPPAPPRTLMSAATRISAPPASTLACSVAPPHHTAVSAANSTSVDITIAAAAADSRAAPYCRHRLETMNASAWPAAGSSQAARAAGQATAAAARAE